MVRLSHQAPSLRVSTFSGFDKVVHALMYLVTCGMFWTEYFRHRLHFKPRVLLLVAVVFPILMSGAIELAQAYLTTCRSGDWWDFAANSLGVCMAFLLARLYHTHQR